MSRRFLGVALNEVFVPLLQRTFPEIADFYLPAEGCSYRMAIVSIRKQYAGHAKRVMFGVWSFLRQFMYTKFIVVTDDDINVRDWKEVIWAISTRVDPVRDTLLIDNTPIDYLDFASPVAGLGGKMGIDATNKWPGETQREWGRPISMDAASQGARRCDVGSTGDLEMERKPIRRGGIKSAGYDRNNRVLEIEFDNGSIIQHTAVGEEIARQVYRKLVAGKRLQGHHPGGVHRQAREVSAYRKNSVARPRKMNTPMLSVVNVSSTEEPSAGSRPARSSTSGTKVPTIAAISMFKNHRQ